MSNPYESSNPSQQPGEQGQPPSDQPTQPWSSNDSAGASDPYGATPNGSGDGSDAQPTYGSSAASASDPYGSQPGYGTQPTYGSSAASASEPYGSQPGYGNQDPYGSQPNTQNPYGAAQNPYGAQSGYGTPAPYGSGYGYSAPMPHPQGTTILVLGIVGLVVCAPAGIVAIVMGGKALKEVDANPSAYSNRQSIVAGRILGIIGVALWALIIIFYVIVAVIAVGSSAGN